MTDIMGQDKSEMGAPGVSIGMPVYNGAKYIREALDSVVAQTYSDFELLISDNVSDDETQAICNEYCKKDPRFKYFRQAKNIGGFGNFKFVLQEARGGLFTWLAHDDVLQPEFLKESVSYMTQQSSAVLVAGDFGIIDGDGKELGVEILQGIRPHIKWAKRCTEFFKYPISNVYLCIYGVMRSDVCKAIMQSLQESKVMAGSELPVLARFAVAGEIASIPSILRKYRRHEASVYMTELAALSKRSVFHGFATSICNLYERRLDQMSVLLSSSLPPKLKYMVMVKVLLSYVTSSVCLAARIVSKMSRRLGLRS